MGSRLWKQVSTALLLCASCAHRPGTAKDTETITFVAKGALEAGGTQAVVVSAGRITHVGTRESAAALAPEAATVEVEHATWSPPFAAARVVLPRLPAGTPLHDEEPLLAPLRELLRNCIAAGLVEIEAGPMTLPQWQALQTWDALGQVPLRVQAWVDAQGHESDEWLARGPFRGRMVAMNTARFVLTAASLAPEARPALAERIHAFSSAGFRSLLVVSDSMLLAAVENFLQSLPLEAGKPAPALELEGAAALAGTQLPRSSQVTWVLSEAAMRMVSSKTSAWLKEARPVKVLLTPAAAMPVSSVLKATAALLEGCGNDAPCQLAARTALFVATPNGQLVAGSPADFAALSVNPLNTSAAQLSEGRALLTVVEGVTVFRR